MLISATIFEHRKHPREEVPNAFSAHFYNWARSSCQLPGLNENGQGAHGQAFCGMGEVFRSSTFKVNRHNKSTSVPPASLLPPSAHSRPHCLSSHCCCCHSYHPRPYRFSSSSSSEANSPNSRLSSSISKPKSSKSGFELGIRENTDLLFDSWGLVDVDAYSGIAIFHSLSCFRS